LLYVAATRAKHRLHLLACLPCDEHGELKKVPARSLLDRAWAYAEEFIHAEEPPAPAAPPAGADLYTTTRLARGFRLPPPPPATQWSAPPEEREEEEI